MIPIDAQEPRQQSVLLPHQLRIYDGLLRHGGPGPAAFYRDACKIIAAEDFETATHLAAHCLREIQSAFLAGLLQPMMAAPRQQGESGTNAATQVGAALEALGVPMGDTVRADWLHCATRVHGMAHRRGLDRPRPLDDEFRKVWARFERVLDVVLDRLAAHALRYYRVVDELLVIERPTREDVRRLYNEVPQTPPIMSYFFGHLRNPAWLPLLRKKGYFSHVPDPVRDISGATAFPHYPQADYLSAVAAQCPDDVADVLLTGVPETRNVRAVDQLLEVAVALPAKTAVRLLPLVKQWVATESPYRSGLEFGALCVAFAEDGLVDEAFELATKLFEVRSVSAGLDAFAAGQENGRRLWLDDFHYAEALEQVVPALLKGAGTRTIAWLSELLSVVVQHSQSQVVEPPTDHSAIWLHSIEDGPSEYETDIRTAVVTLLRDALRTLKHEGSCPVEQLVVLVEAQPWHVHRRIALDLLAFDPTAAPAAVFERLADPENLSSSSIRHEYAQLLRRAFRHLSAADQDRMLGLIERHARDVPSRQMAQAQHGSLASHADTQERTERVLRDWISYVADDLPEGWRERYASYVAKYGPASVVDAFGKLEVRLGSESPKSVDELATMGPDELVCFLRNWRPPESELLGPSYRGLAGQVEALAANKPELFQDRLSDLTSLEPTYVSAVICGLESALQEATAWRPGWGPVLELGAFLAAQPATDVEVQPMDLDSDWRWARQAMLRLLRGGLALAGERAIPLDARERVWAAILPLTRDPNPTVDFEARFGGDNMDAFTLSLNTTRGQAIHSVLQYALWIQRNSDVTGPDAGLDLMPEVFDVLDHHLESRNDSSQVARAAIGANLDRLWHLSRSWVEASLPGIFPNRDEFEVQRRAAWDAYLAYSRVGELLSEDGLALLEGEYRSAIHELKHLPPSPSRHRSLVDQRLADHLIIHYIRGHIDLSPASLLSAFFDRAPLELRCNALAQAGRFLNDASWEADSRELDRLWELWTWRRDIALGATGDRKELAAFGFWYAGDRLASAISFAELRRVLEAVGHVDCEHAVVGKLEQLSTDYPVESLACLEAVFRRQLDGVRQYYWLRGGEAILRSALESGDTELVERARELINRMAGHGYLKYRALLEQNRFLSSPA